MKKNEFKKLLNYLNSHFQIIDFSEVNQFSNDNRKKIVITFDDAFLDFKENVFPIISPLKIPVTLNIIVSCCEKGTAHWTQKLSCLSEEFICKKKSPVSCLNDFQFPQVQDLSPELLSLNLFRHLREKNMEDIELQIKSFEDQLNFDTSSYTKMMTWEDISVILNEYDNIHIGSHTINHRDLSSVHMQSELEDEIISSESIIKKTLGIECNRFAFPNGGYNDEALEIVNRSNYSIVQFTENVSLSKLNANLNQNFVARIIPYYDSFEENIFKIYGFHNKVLKSSRK